MRIHPREERCRKAENELRIAVLDITSRHELTEAEGLRVAMAALGGWVGDVAKCAIREERHGDPSKPGGLT